jgi:hypothetical protein
MSTENDAVASCASAEALEKMSDRELDLAVERVFGKLFPRVAVDPRSSKALRDEMRRRGWSFSLVVCAAGDTRAEFDNGIIRGIADSDTETELRSVVIAALKAVSSQGGKV